MLLRRNLLSLIFIAFTIPSFSQVYIGKSASDKFPNAQKILLDRSSETLKYVEFAKPEMVSELNHNNWLTSLLDGGNQTEFRLIRKFADNLGQTHYRYGQYFNGIRIEGGVFIVHTSSGSILSANGNFLKKTPQRTSASLSPEAAFKAAKKSIPSKLYQWEAEKTSIPASELVYISLNNQLVLAYKLDIYSYDPLDRSYVYVDAGNGSILRKQTRIYNTDVPGTAHTKYHGIQTITTDSISPSLFKLKDNFRKVFTYDMNTSTTYSSAVDFTDSDNIWNTTTNQDDAALDAHFGAEKTYDFYFVNYGLDSYDGAGASINSYVHFDFNYVNAFWDGSRMTYGDGDGFNFSALTSVEIAGHEITHAVTEFSANLVYQDEPGALNESFSDIFGTAIDFYADPLNANWFIGDLVNITGNGFRNMENPNLLNDPDTYHGNFWFYGSSDHGGVHTNSSVQNYWYYLLVNGGTGVNDNGSSYSVAGIGMDAANDIAYRNLSVYLTVNSQFSDARFYAIQSAVDLFGTCSDQEVATTNAWYAVGVGAEYFNTVSAQFNASSTYSCTLPASVLFSNTSVNDDTRIWDFGDGTTDTAYAPTHIYTTTGTYTVSLITFGSTDCGDLTDTLILPDYITITNDGGPVNACIPTISSGDSGYGIFNLTFNTINHSTAGADEGYQDYSCLQSTTVTAGDYINLSITTGTNSEENVKVFIDSDANGVFDLSEEIYADNGFQSHSGLVGIPDVQVYNSPLRLRVISDINPINNPCVTSATFSQIEDYSITILPVSEAPVANFTVSDSVVLTGSTALFTDISTGLPTSWQWSFPGGIPATSDSQNPSVLYNTVGNYDVQLIVTNEFGSDTLNKPNYINVTNSFNMCGSTTTTEAVAGLLYDSGGPSGNYSNSENCNFLIQPGCADSIVLSFNAFSLESGFDYLRVYDGVNSSAPLILSASGAGALNPVIAISGAMYIVFTSDGSVTRPGFDAQWTTVQFSTSPPVAEFDISDLNPPLAVAVEFTDQSSNSPNEWLWDFGDGNFSIEQNPSHFYTTSGNKTVQLIAKTCNESDTIVHNLTVQEMPILSINPTSYEYTFTSCTDSITVPFSVYNTGAGDLIIDDLVGTIELDSLQSLITYTNSGATTTHIFSDLPSFSANDTIHVTINMDGDFDSDTEFASLFIDGTSIGVIPDFNQFIVHYQFDLYGDQLAAFLEDGLMQFDIENSSNVDIFTELNNFHEVIIELFSDSYIYPQPNNDTIAPGDSSIINVTISASGLLPGTYTDSLAIFTNDLNNNPLYLPITIINNGIADMALSSYCLEFDTIMQFSTDSLPVEIFNSGCDTLEVTGLSVEGNDFIVSPALINILPFASDTIWVYFSPQNIGLSLDTIQVSSNVYDTTICLSGYSFGAPIISINPDSLDVNISSCGDSVIVPITVYNTGAGILNYTTNGAGSGSALNVVAWTLAADMFQEYPNTIDAINEYFTEYSLVETSTTSPDIFDSILDSANLLLIPEQEDNIGGFNSQMAAIVQEFVLNGGWVIRCGTGYTNNINSMGLFNATSVQYQANGTQIIVDSESPLLTNTALPIAINDANWVTHFSNSDFVEVTSYDFYSVTGYIDYGLGKAIFISYDYFSYDDNASRIIANAFEWAANSNSNWLSVSPDSDSILPGDSAIVYVNINSSGLINGDYSAEITINSNDPVHAIAYLPVNLHLNGDPEIGFSESCLVFDDILEFETDTAFVDIFNQGCDTLNISNIISSSAQIVPDTTTLSILPGESFPLSVIFSPENNLGYSGNLTFISDAGDTTLCFEGNATAAPVIELSQESVGVTLNCNDSTMVSVVLYNTGPGDLIVDPLSDNSGSDSLKSMEPYFTSGASTTHIFSDLPGGIDTLHITINMDGDFDGFSEFATLTIDGFSFGEIPDLDQFLVTYQFDLYGSQLTGFLEDGNLEFILSNSFEVDIFTELNNFHEVIIEFEGNTFIIPQPFNQNISPGDSTVVSFMVNSSDLDPGTYFVDYIFSSNDPLTPFLPFQVNLLVNDVPCAGFSFDQDIDNCSGVIQFTSTSEGNQLTYDWDFGDGSTSTSQNPLHIYTELGVYNVKLVVSNPNGIDSLLQEVFVNPYNVSFVYAGFLNVEQEIQFAQVGSNSTSWIWFFGDGTSSSDANPTHIYSAAGEYNVTLSTQNNEGCSANYTETLIILPPLSIEEYEAKIEFNLYPNPTNGSFFITYKGVRNSIDIKLINQIGQVVYTNRYNYKGDGEIKIENLSLAPGIYMMHFTDDDVQKIMRLIVE